VERALLRAAFDLDFDVDREGTTPVVPQSAAKKESGFSR
jgi:hypothetical protein